MKKWLPFLFTAVLLFACHSQEEAEPQVQKQAAMDYSDGLASFDSLSPAQEKAFNLLDSLQTSSDQAHRLFSTFPGSYHEGFPPDSSLSLSSSQFKTALQQFIRQNYARYSEEESNNLAQQIALLQEDYQLLLCLPESSSREFSTTPAQEGIWVLPKLLGRRDLVLVW